MTPEILLLVALAIDEHAPIGRREKLADMLREAIRRRRVIVTWQLGSWKLVVLSVSAGDDGALRWRVQVDGIRDTVTPARALEELSQPAGEEATPRGRQVLAEIVSFIVEMERRFTPLPASTDGSTACAP